MITVSNDHLRYYNDMHREITIMKMELEQHISDMPTTKFYKSNWIMKKKALESSIEDFKLEASQWAHDNPECFV